MLGQKDEADAKMLLLCWSSLANSSGETSRNYSLVCVVKRLPPRHEVEPKELTVDVNSECIGNCLQLWMTLIL